MPEIDMPSVMRRVLAEVQESNERCVKAMAMPSVMRRVLAEVQESISRGRLRAYGRCHHCRTVVNAEFEPEDGVRGKLVACPGCGHMAAVERGAVDILPE